MNCIPQKARTLLSSQEFSEKVKKINWAKFKRRNKQTYALG